LFEEDDASCFGWNAHEPAEYESSENDSPKIPEPRFILTLLDEQLNIDMDDDGGAHMIWVGDNNDGRKLRK